MQLSTIQLHSDPRGFVYGFVENLFPENLYERLVATFPDPKTFKFINKQSGGGNKRFYVGPDYHSHLQQGCIDGMKITEAWKDVMREASSPDFIAQLSRLTGVKCNNMSQFGFTYGNEGCMQGAHVDGAVREYEKRPVAVTLACLLYFNKHPDTVGGTCVYANDRTTVVFQAPHLRNGMMFFQQHPEAWHGFPELPRGAERHLVSLSYSNEPEPVLLREGLLHRLTCKQFLKSQFRQFPIFR